MTTRKAIVDAFVAAIHERPGDFSIGKCTLEDRKSGLEFWIGNGVPFYGVYRPYEMNFGLIQGIRFGWWLRRFKAAKAAQLLKAAP